MQYFEEKLAEMPRDVLEKAVAHLDSLFTEETKKDIREAHAEDPEKWWAEAHGYWGTSVRNSLRSEAGLTDDLLPDHNWDDYYIPCVEIAIGVRPMPEVSR